jgi:hypothetical protein
MPLRTCPQPSSNHATLRTLIRSQARRAARRFSPAVARDLLEEAESYIGWKIFLRKLDPRHSQFPAAVSKALLRRAVDLHRRRAKQPMPLLGDQPVPSPAGEPDETGGYIGKLEEARLVLDRIRWRPAAPGGVDLFAVLLLHLRLSLAAAFGRVQADNHDQPLSHMPDFVAWCLAWREDEEGLRIAPGLALLRDAWAALEPDLATPPHRLPVTSVCRALGASDGLKTSRWDQWTCRARQQAKDRMGAQAWDDLFARWLPGQKTSAG